MEELIIAAIGAAKTSDKSINNSLLIALDKDALRLDSLLNNL
jgi:hypothetical protein